MRQNTKIQNPMLTNHDLWLLFIPLIIEQGLEYIVGLADSLMHLLNTSPMVLWHA